MLDQPYSATLGMLRSVSTAATLISASPKLRVKNGC